MATRKKHQRLPNGYGSIRYLGKGRRNAYAVHPPADIDGNRPPAICYVSDWMQGFIVLTAYKAGTYTPGMETTLELPDTTSRGLEALASRLLADYARVKGVEPAEPERTFSDVYQAFYALKFREGHRYSQSTVDSTRAAYKNCAALHDRIFRDLRTDDLQQVIDDCPLKHSSLELIVNLYRQMYSFADGQKWCDKRYDQFVRINKKDDDERGVPFTDAELSLFWRRTDIPEIELMLIICYSGWRISEISSLTVDLNARTFCGGVKTQAGKGRTVPIHTLILPLVERRLNAYGSLLPETPAAYRKHLRSTLESLGISGEPPHTPHDGRHTFSRLCEKYGVRENDCKRMMGHAFSDVTNRVYGHRSLEDLRTEIEKIRLDL